MATQKYPRSDMEPSKHKLKNAAKQTMQSFVSNVHVQQDLFKQIRNLEEVAKTNAPWMNGGIVTSNDSVPARAHTTGSSSISVTCLLGVRGPPPF